jgi:NAD(P)-dependent dehydrogenase (short-subunit alcohol dehydrogenase family)
MTWHWVSSIKTRSDDKTGLKMLSNRVALVTGATGGLGRVVVKRFLTEGATVAAVYRNEDKLKKLVEYIGDNKINGFKADVTDPASVSSLVAEVTKQLGRIDVLLNIVGGYTGGMLLQESEEAVLDKMVTLNTRSAWLCSRAVLPGMIERNWGRIVSVAAKNATSRGRRAGNIAYAISKGGVITLTEALAEELSKVEVNVNCVMPATIDTAENREKMPKADTSKWVSPEDIAEVMIFLSSDSSKAVTGAAIPIFGRSYL